MHDWWSYSLSDFLLFSPRTYYRMIERHNDAVWPAQLLTIALGVGIIGALRRPSTGQGSIIAGILGVLWVWVAWAFLLQRYATINPAATYFAFLFILQAVLLFWHGVLRRDLQFTAGPNTRNRLGLSLFVAAVTVYPWLAPVLGRPWQQAEVFGVFPDPTVLASLGILLMENGRSPWKLMIIPIVWCAITGATMWAIARVDA